MRRFPTPLGHCYPMKPELLTVILATLGLPILVLAADYIPRMGNLAEAMNTAGPDLCLLGLGSIGAIFIDKKVADAFPIAPQLMGVFVAIFIMILRNICGRLSKMAGGAWSHIRGFWSLVSGLAAVLIVGWILIYSYSR